MGPKIDLTGNKYGRLLVISFSHKNKHGSSCWKCVCECGQITIKEGYTMKRGDTRSCGCLDRENLNSGNNRRRHGQSKTKNYKVWACMLQRCHNPKNRQYPGYGGRGIKVCKRWYVFDNFLKDMGEKPSPKHSLDRINNDKGYSKKNCRWATKDVQSRNTRSNVYIEHKGETKTLLDWSKTTGLSKSIVKQRLDRGFSMEEALSPTHLYGYINDKDRKK